MTENETEKSLTPKQLKAIEGLLTAGNAADAATMAGSARGTLYRWLKEPEFQAALRVAEGEALRTLARRVVGLGDLAADALKDALQPGQTLGQRLRAAAIVVDKGPELMELASVLERLDQLEAALNARRD